MASSLSLASLERHDRIVDFIHLRQRASVDEIAARFAISAATVRRDLEILDRHGEIERFHGGAQVTRHAPPELPVLQRQSVLAAEKQAIGQAAAMRVQEGDTIFIGSGTTALQVALHLRTYQNLTVITNSVLVINALSDLATVTLVGLGGVFRQSEMSLIGHITERGLAEVHAAKIIIGIRAIDIERGLTNDYLPETMTDRAILAAGRQVIIAADHTKCGRISTAFVAPITAMHVLITDAKTPAEFVCGLEGHGIEVMQVST